MVALRRRVFGGSEPAEDVTHNDHQLTSYQSNDMLDIVFGKKTNPQAVGLLVEELSTTDWTGTLYVGTQFLEETICRR